jgi:AraC-like DNA-binding protein
MGIERYSISIHFARMLMNASHRLQLDEAVLLKEAGLNRRMLENAHLRITPDQFSRLMRAVWRLADDEFLGMGSQRCRQGVFAIMAKQVVHSHNLHSVYYKLSHFYNVVNDSLHLSLDIVGDEAIFSMVLKDPAQDPGYLLRGFLLLLWHRFPSWLIGKRIPLKYVAFDHPAPKHLAEYPLMFPCPATFDQAVTCLVFDAAILTAPLVQTPETLGHHLKRAPVDWFTRPAYYPVYTRRVLDHLERSEDLAEASTQSAALELHLTERTLRRKLAAEGSQFQRLKDGVRRDMAIHYLSQTSMSISLISQVLGFSEPSAFTRAFRQWTGELPKTYRAVARQKK